MTSREGIRVGDAERDAAMEFLREHYAQGRLTREELDERLEVALSARTSGDLALVSADLSGPHTSGSGSAEDAWARHRAAAGYRHRKRRGGPPIPPPLILLLVAGVAFTGFGVLKVLLAIALVATVVSLVHRRRGHAGHWGHHGHRHGHRHGHGHGHRGHDGGRARLSPPGAF